MTIEQMRKLWPVAKLLHEARRDMAWGAAGKNREKWPEWSQAYPHNPIAFVDLALAQAAAVEPMYDALIEVRSAIQAALDEGQQPVPIHIEDLDAALPWMRRPT